MTGWQSGGGDQGGWNQNQSFGPEAQTNRYNDPYANQYGSDPYTSGPYGTDPPGPDPYSYDPYGQQQYPPSGGFPAPGYGPPPPPPKRSKLPMILSLVAIVIIVGAVVAIVLVNREDNQPVAEPSSTSTPENTSSGSEPSDSESADPSTSGGGGEHEDWLSIDNTADAGLSYQVPPDWQESSSDVSSGLGVQFTGRADYGLYQCEGNGYARTFAASGDVQGEDGADLDLSTTIEDFAKGFAAQGYGEDAQVEVPAPTEVEVDGKTAMTLTAKVTVNVTVPNCQASQAEVAIIGVPLESDGGPKGVAMLVVVNDLAGGPADTEPLDASVTQEILTTVRPG